MSDSCKLITEYLLHGGLFNPELMEHGKVRDLLIECRDEIQKLKQDREKLVEALSRYANKDMWRRGLAGTPDVPWFNVAIESSVDTEWFEDEHRHVSGGIARQALKEIGE